MNLIQKYKMKVFFSVVRKAWAMLGILGVAALEIILVAVPVKDLFREHLALGSSVAVTCEMVS